MTHSVEDAISTKDGRRKRGKAKNSVASLAEKAGQSEREREREREQSVLPIGECKSSEARKGPAIPDA